MGFFDFIEYLQERAFVVNDRGREAEHVTREREITREIGYKPLLDLKPFTMNYTKQRTKYSLQSVSVHEGSLGGGHYYAYCINHLDGDWRKYNDTHVSKVGVEEVLGSRPYLLFYKRV